uniref:Uncharacterized protein n=1 Tax=Timema monikensis TaxID=170555 RepID=A0A7R9HNQ3_9NEOP|nr:unnamed protein product [Timema monikensis]
MYDGSKACVRVDGALSEWFDIEQNVRQGCEIGSCSNLTIISVRNNKLQEVPAELGHLPSIRMINLSENLLCNLPVSILKLSHLTALWLSNNQNTPLVTLHKEIDKETRQTVCVNFMLPQTIQDRYYPKGQLTIQMRSTLLIHTHTYGLRQKQLKINPVAFFELPLHIPRNCEQCQNMFETCNKVQRGHHERLVEINWHWLTSTLTVTVSVTPAFDTYGRVIHYQSCLEIVNDMISFTIKTIVDEVVPLLGELVSPESSDVQIKEAKRKRLHKSGKEGEKVHKRSESACKREKDQEKGRAQERGRESTRNSITWQNNATASSRPSENSSVHASGDRPIIREAKFVRHINSSSLLQHAEKVNLIEPTSLQSQLLVVDSEYFKNQRLNIEPKTEQPLQPPPYHIAAAYSKQAIWFEHPPNCAKNSKLLRVPSSSESLHKAYVVGESK